MDLAELGKIYMDQVRSFIANKYLFNIEEDKTLYCLESEDDVIRASFTIFSGHVQSLANRCVEHFDFLKQVGEIGTFVRIKRNDDGSLDVIHIRCIRDEDINKFAMMACATNLSDITGKLTSDTVISWAYPFIGVTFDEMMMKMGWESRFERSDVEPEYAFDINPGDIIKSMDDLATIMSNKLDVTQSR